MADIANKPQITVRYWAGAQRAAGRAVEELSAGSVGELRAVLAGRPELRRISEVASFLVDARQAGDATPLFDGAEVDVLPPFAGGAPLIVGIGGSTREGSVTNLLLDACLDRVAALGARVAALHGADLATLPIYTGAGSGEADGLIDAVRHADCLLIATPGYHGGMSGLVKNALDHLEALRDDPRPYLEGRAVGVIVTAAGWQACGTALVSVRSAIHALRGWPTPFGVTMNSVEQTADDPRVLGGLDIVAAQLMRFAAWQSDASVNASVR